MRSVLVTSLSVMRCCQSLGERSTRGDASGAVGLSLFDGALLGASARFNPCMLLAALGCVYIYHREFEVEDVCFFS